MLTFNKIADVYEIHDQSRAFLGWLKREPKQLNEYIFLPAENVGLNESELNEIADKLLYIN